MMNMSKQEIESELLRLDNKIEECKEIINDLNNNPRTMLFKKREIKKYQSILEEFLKLQELYKEQLKQFDDMSDSEKLEEKRNVCQTLIDTVSNLNQIYDENNNIITVSEEIKLAFITEIKKFMESNSLRYVFYESGTKDWQYTNTFVYQNHNINVIVTVNDFLAAAKQHKHLKTVDEMLCTFIKHYKSDDDERRM